MTNYVVTPDEPRYQFSQTWPVQYLGSMSAPRGTSSDQHRYECWVDFDTSRSCAWSPYVHWAHADLSACSKNIEAKFQAGTDSDDLIFNALKTYVIENWWFILNRPKLLTQGPKEKCLMMFKGLAE